MDWLRVIHGEQPSTPLTFGTGDEVRVWYRITEQGKERLGQFEGICIRSRGCGVSRSFTVRRITYGEGVERTFPVDAKIISRIEVLRKGKVHRARLYFLRRAIGKTRIQSQEPETSVGGVAIVNRTSENSAGEPERMAVAADKPAASTPPPRS